MNKINLKGITSEAVTGVLILVIALINAVLQMFGINTLPIENEEISVVVSGVFVIGAALYNTWKNRNIPYLASKGNRNYLFADDIYSNVTQSPYNDYEIPSAALSDETFRKLITEAEKYLGYPYVWGGSSPSTSFDCSGFVCWVFKNSGVYPLSRTTAQGIFNQCTAVRPAEAKPGDIIFFTGTYNSGSPVSHVGIYVGNGMMIHCGNPIQYASVNSSYWSSHFYAYGRLN